MKKIIFVFCFLAISTISFSQGKIDLTKYKSMTYSELINDTHDIWFTGKRFLTYDRSWNCWVDVKTGIHWGNCYGFIRLTDGDRGTIKITRKKLMKNKDGTYNLPGKGEIAYTGDDPRNPKNRSKIDPPMDKANPNQPKQPVETIPDPLSEFRKEFGDLTIQQFGDYWQDVSNPANKFVYRNHHWRRAVYDESCFCWN